VRDAIGAAADTPLIVADASDPASVKGDGRETKSVITTVGAYQLYGSELMSGCVAGGVITFDLWRRAGLDAADDRQA